jgi:hypothetical protein
MSPKSPLGSRTLVPTAVGWLKPLQDAAEILFRFAAAVLHRGVEVVYADGDPAPYQKATQWNGATKWRW